MKVLVIPDIHGRKFWREAVANNIGKVDKVIFLGDYLDPYQEEINHDPDKMECNDFYDCINLTQMLNDIVALKKNEPDKFILLCGNHTCSYIWSKFHAATRTDYRHWEGYHKFFSENLNLFNLVWIKNDVIFSHAGISEAWASHFLDVRMKYDDSALENISYIRECAELLRDTPLDKFNSEYVNGISEISTFRWGEYPNGSSEWADIQEHVDFLETKNQEHLVGKKTEGIFQVFGHTQLKNPLKTDYWICLDCRRAFIFDTISHECNSCL